jgi:2,6-dihydroxypyridine 3-monooxygenase
LSFRADFGRSRITAGNWQSDADRFVTMLPEIESRGVATVSEVGIETLAERTQHQADAARARTPAGLRWPRVGVVGGSLGGLTAAHLLRDLGCDVTVYERSAAELEARGAGIVVLPETSRYLRERTDIPLDAVTCSTRLLRYLGRDGKVVHEEVRPYRYSGWRTIYAALLGSFDIDRYRLRSEMTHFAITDGAVDVTFADGSADRVDLLVCADGIASRSRAALLPEVVPCYAGYVAWRGTVEEAVFEERSRAAFADALVYQSIPASHILVYPIPNADGSTESGRRLLNFVWYRNYAQGGPLSSLMTNRDGVVCERTLPPGEVRSEHINEARAFARANLAPPFADLVAETPEPFVQAIVDIEVPRMAFGRICLIGDAAFALRPHIAAGTAKAAADAWALADALATTGGAVEPALAMWERSQLEIGRRALGRARRNGTRSQFEGTWDPADPSLAFGLGDP